MRKFKSLGMLVGGAATTASPKQSISKRSGFDFVIAQGGEAGGHRGTWLRDPYDALTGTLALTRLVLSGR